MTAVLWDLDGTLIDSERYWMDTEVALVAEHGGEWTREDALACIGKSVPFAAALMVERGVDLTVDEITDELFRRMDVLIRTRGLPYRPGALELLTALNEAGHTQALVTQSFGPYVEAAVAAAPAAVFATVRTGDTVAHPKPAPDLYEAAMRDLGLGPRDCLAIEDSPAGAGAIVAAGVTPIVVPCEVPVPDLPGVTRWETLEGVTPEDLYAVHAAFRER